MAQVLLWLVVQGLGFGVLGYLGFKVRVWGLYLYLSPATQTLLGMGEWMTRISAVGFMKANVGICSLIPYNSVVRSLGGFRV